MSNRESRLGLNFDYRKKLIGSSHIKQRYHTVGRVSVHFQAVEFVLLVLYRYIFIPFRQQIPDKSVISTSDRLSCLLLESKRYHIVSQF